MIDPRNGETFYVGKGKGDRVFAHARAAISSGEAGEIAQDLKLRRINEILNSGLAVLLVIHRHGIETADVAYEVESALMDAFPGLTNKIAGQGSSEFGVAHADQLIAAYGAEEFRPTEPLILISIGRSGADSEKSTYDAVRGAWKINPGRAESYGLVLAHRVGLVVGAFRPIGKWLQATPDNFPWLEEAVDGRWGFKGKVADRETLVQYVGMRVPDRYRKQGAANPVRFIDL